MRQKMTALSSILMRQRTAASTIVKSLDMMIVLMIFYLECGLAPHVIKKLCCTNLEFMHNFESLLLGIKELRVPRSLDRS